jgi:hypothetical protein
MDNPSKYFTGRRTRVSDQGTKDETGERVSNFDVLKRILVRPVSEVYRARFAISSSNVSPVYLERMDCDYFVSTEKANHVTRTDDGSLVSWRQTEVRSDEGRQ